jgi:hypothetical protein
MCGAGVSTAGPITPQLALEIVAEAPVGAIGENRFELIISGP